MSFTREDAEFVVDQIDALLTGTHAWLSFSLLKFKCDWLDYDFMYNCKPSGYLSYARAGPVQDDRRMEDTEKHHCTLQSLPALSDSQRRDVVQWSYADFKNI